MRGAVHHIEIYVADLMKTRVFWDWLMKELAYDVYQEWPAGVSYKLNDTYLVFVQVEKHHLEQRFHRCKAGLNHLAFSLESNQDVDIMTEKLRKRDVTILYEDRHPYAGGENYYAVFFEDYDRLKVELVSLI